MDLRPAIAALELALAQAEALAERAKEPGAGLAGAIAELRASLLEVKRQCLAAQEDLSGLEELLAAHDQLTLERGMVWRFIGDKKIAGPYCPKCHAASGELVKLDYHPGAVGHHPQAPFYACARCGARFAP